MNDSRRLTKHCEQSGTPVPNRDTIGDFCMMMPVGVYDSYDTCKDCPIGKMIDRLCAYEDTGLEPEEIVTLKESAALTYGIPRKLRACFVEGEGEAYFHEWTKISQIVAPSLLKGGHSGGVISGTLGIVEFAATGRVATVDPKSIRFTDFEGRDGFQDNNR